MKKLEYNVTFVTPAFMGNANQDGQWRTPPFKALMRQWWRVVYAVDHAFHVDPSIMRREEGLLFGNAWLSHREHEREVADHRKSLVRIRLDRWEMGNLRGWQGLEQPSIFHPETEKTGFKVGPHAYLGYGPLDGRGNTRLDRKRNAAIQAGESAGLSLAVAASHKDAEIASVLDANLSRLERVVSLMNMLGTVGGRSRNGWGSFSLTPKKGTPDLPGGAPSRMWHEALSLDWPHAIGSDEKGALIWTTKPFADWKPLMRELAIVKVGLRTQFVFPNTSPPHQRVESRHLLAYPITRHTTKVWKPGSRLPNSLRFKVRPDPQHPQHLIGIIFHVPCRPPADFKPDLLAITQTWRAVHALLDELTQPASSRSYLSISNAERKTKLRPQLDAVTLARTGE